ncbi:integrase core domain-containing protein [Sphingomonas pokkalii]
MNTSTRTGFYRWGNARARIKAWRAEFNESRPHTSRGS